MKNLKTYICHGIIFVSVLGTLLHFAYEWSGNNFIVGLFTPINESIWEHTKLIFFPMLLYSLFPNKKLNSTYPCLSSNMFFSSFIGIWLIISLFYTYTGIIGYSVLWCDILIFFISVTVSFYIAYRKTALCDKDNIIFKILQVVMIGLYVFFTIFPLNIPLFISPA